jgi:hypothetical protein
MTWLTSTRPPRVAIVVLLLVAAGSFFAYHRLLREEPAPYFESAEDHFLYGSIGTEADRGLPYWVWVVLPRIFPDYLPRPGGYASLGVLARDGHEMPIGLSKVTIGVPRVGINCAMCHTASVRASRGDVPVIYPGAPAHQTGAQEYKRFLIACAADPRFTAGTILGEIAKNVRLSFLDRLLYRFAIIPGTRRALLRLRDDDVPLTRRPESGRGRADVFNPIKFTILGQPIDGTIGSADMMPMWNLARAERTSFHWDGLNTSLREAVASSAVNEGATAWWMDRDAVKWDRTEPGRQSSLRRVMEYISALKPPKYPFPIDAKLSAAGAATFASACSQCHGAGGNQTGSVIPFDEIGTDRSRLDTWTPAAADRYNAYGDRHDWKFSGFRKTNGYLAAPLEGTWLAAPYLHNGSVPTLTDLLEPPESRPRRFWRGYDVYDPARAGFVSGGEDAEREGTVFDVTLPGNGNGGHTYGVTLTPGEKRALLEYLKTL